MSSFLCSENTIKLIAFQATADSCSGRWSHNMEKVQRAVNVLWGANLAALRDRYGEKIEEQPSAPTVTVSDLMRLHAHAPVVVLKQLSCYEYQASDWREWEGSEAQLLCARAQSSAQYRLPGYDKAPWGDL